MTWPDEHGVVARENLRRMVPEHLHDGLAHYIEDGCETGHFLTAVLQGDLFRAALTADGTNYPRLADIATFIVWYAPLMAYGSAERVEAWIERGGLTHGALPQPAHGG